MLTLRAFGQDGILSVSASLTWSGRDFLSACFDVHRDDVSTARWSSLSSDKKSQTSESFDDFDRLFQLRVPISTKRIS